MKPLSPIPLTPTAITLGSPDFDALLSWPFQDGYVARLLEFDIPQRVQFGECHIWMYRDPQRRPVGFGTLDICDDYSHLTQGLPHTYVPLLAVNPTITSLGFGTSIVRHLMMQARIAAARHRVCDDRLFLDVYATNTKAIGVYAACGFVSLTQQPLIDSQEGNAGYHIMATELSGLQKSLPSGS